MFGISFTEIIVICLLLLIVFGPERLPQLASKVGKLLGSTKKTADKFRREFYNSVYQPAQEIESKVKTELKAVDKEIEETKKIEQAEQKQENE